MPQMIGGLVRHLLTMLGGAAVAKGYIDAAGVEAAIGAAVTLIGVAWSMIEKRKREPK